MTVRWALVVVYWAGALTLAASLPNPTAILGASLMLYAIVGRIMMGFLP